MQPSIQPAQRLPPSASFTRAHTTNATATPTHTRARTMSHTPTPRTASHHSAPQPPSKPSQQPSTTPLARECDEVLYSFTAPFWYSYIDVIHGFDRIMAHNRSMVTECIQLQSDCLQQAKNIQLAVLNVNDSINTVHTLNTNVSDNFTAMLQTLQKLQCVPAQQNSASVATTAAATPVTPHTRQHSSSLQSPHRASPSPFKRAGSFASPTLISPTAQLRAGSVSATPTLPPRSASFSLTTPLPPTPLSSSSSTYLNSFGIPEHRMAAISPLLQTLAAFSSSAQSPARMYAPSNGNAANSHATAALNNSTPQQSSSTRPNSPLSQLNSPLPSLPSFSSVIDSDIDWLTHNPSQQTRAAPI